MNCGSRKATASEMLIHAIEIKVAVCHEMPVVLKEYEEAYRIYKPEFKIFEGGLRFPKPCLSVELHAHTGSPTPHPQNVQYFQEEGIP